SLTPELEQLPGGLLPVLGLGLVSEIELGLEAKRRFQVERHRPGVSAQQRPGGGRQPAFLRQVCRIQADHQRMLPRSGQERRLQRTGAVLAAPHVEIADERRLRPDQEGALIYDHQPAPEVLVEVIQLIAIDLLLRSNRLDEQRALEWLARRN